MSAAVTATAPMLSPAEFVRGLSPGEKDAILAELLRERGAIYPGEVIPLPADDASLGHFFPAVGPTAAADAVYAQLAPEMRQALMQPYIELDLDDTLSEEELNALITGEADPKPPL